jgi:NTP pyrophosphatase (non-canonical NTP hydrolase)
MAYIKLMPGLRRAMTFGSLQREISERYAENDRKMGVPFLAMVLVEEVGEFAEAARKGDAAESGKEIADVAFMCLAIANVLGVDVEAAIRAKFLKRPLGEVTKTWDDVTWREPPR